MIEKHSKNLLFDRHQICSNEDINHFTSKNHKRIELPDNNFYSVFFDENGDSNIDVVNKHKLLGTTDTLDYSKKILCLTAVVIKNCDYIETIKENINIKNKYWPNKNNIVFHSREIRRKEGNFYFKDNSFLLDLSLYIKNQKFNIFYSIIDKLQLVTKYFIPLPPYYLAMAFILEKITHKNNYPKNTKFDLVFESRGKNEDNNLLRLIVDLIIKNGLTTRINKIYFNNKKDRNDNPEVGLELADLCSYPLYSNFCNQKDGRDFQIVSKKVHQYGKKIFPK